MSAASLSTVAYLYKTLWPQDRVENLAYEDNPLLALLPKDENFVGDSLYLAVRYAPSAGRSSTLSTAITNMAAHKGKRFNLTRGHDYASFQVDHESVLAAKKDKGALIRLLDTEVESALFALTRSLAIALYQDGSGTRGQINGSDPGTGTTFTLNNINDVTNFEVGMNIVFAATATGALRAGGARTISAVDRVTGVITVSAAIDAAVGASDYIIAEGDAAAGGSITLPVGLLGWLPSSAPSATTFFGVDRSVDPTRLGGIRVDESTYNPEEGLALCLAFMAREGAKPSHIMRNPIDYKNLMVALGSKVETEYMSVGEVGFTALKVNGPKGQVAIVSDQNCPAGRGFALTMKSLKFYSLGQAPMRIEADGLSMLRDSTTDTFTGRMAYYAQLGCTAPGWNTNETLPS